MRCADAQPSSLPTDVAKGLMTAAVVRACTYGSLPPCTGSNRPVAGCSSTPPIHYRLELASADDGVCRLSLIGMSDVISPADRSVTQLRLWAARDSAGRCPAPEAAKDVAGWPYVEVSGPISAQAFGPIMRMIAEVRSEGSAGPPGAVLYPTSSPAASAWDDFIRDPAKVWMSLDTVDIQGVTQGRVIVRPYRGACSGPFFLLIQPLDRSKPAAVAPQFKIC